MIDQAELLYLPNRRRITIRLLLVLTAVSAVLLGIWKTYYDEPETHQILGYEKAPGTRELYATIGPNRIRIQSIARNRRDGSIALAATPGLIQSGPFPQADVLRTSGPWLDVCQFELQPGTDRVEIIEARVFDHATRTLLTTMSPAFGWQVVRPNLVQVYGLGESIPPLLDVWLRVHSYEAGEPVTLLGPQVGATASIPGGTITLTGIQEGFAGWSSVGGFYPLEEADTSETAMVLESHGEWKEKNEYYQIAAVTEDGEKQFEERVLGMRNTGERQTLLMFDAMLDKIEHFELRPHGGRHRFFFEAVQLPAADNAPFAVPPAIRIPTAQSEVDTTLGQWAPLHVELSLLRGDPVTGSRASGTAARLMMSDHAEDVDSKLTVAYHVRGVPGIFVETQFVDAENGNLIPQSALRNRSGFQATAATHHVSASTIELPLEQVEAIEISLIPPVISP